MSAALILGSTSAYRQALLARLGISFETVAPRTDEAPSAGELPPDRAVRLSIAKARSVAAARPEGVVIGSDQVAALGARTLHKPGNAPACRAQLRELSGQCARFYTGCSIMGPGGRSLVHLDTTEVRFRVLHEGEIARYVEREAPLDCAGGFKAEGLGISLFESISSTDPTALLGLPLIWVASSLRTLGFEIP